MTDLRTTMQDEKAKPMGLSGKQPSFHSNVTSDSKLLDIQILEYPGTRVLEIHFFTRINTENNLFLFKFTIKFC
jgi:hypothetical protein